MEDGIFMLQTTNLADLHGIKKSSAVVTKTRGPEVILGNGAIVH